MKSAVYCVLDRSGSMAECLSDTIGGFNMFLKEQDPDTVLSLTLFGSDIKHIYKKYVRDIEPLNAKTYVPHGGTALLDAIGCVIKSVPIDETPSIVILTDGFENSSTKYSKLHINDLIEEKKKAGWTFVFLAANQDAIQSADELGIPEHSAITFNTCDVSSAFRTLSCGLKRQSTGETQGVHFSKEERTFLE